MGRRAILLGATGLVGGHILDGLLASSAYDRVAAITRRPLARSHPKLEQHIMELEALATAELPPAEDVFCALGTTIKKAGSQSAFRAVDLEAPKALAARTAQNGARQFLLVSSVGADPRSNNFYLRTKGELESALEPLPFQALHIFRPSFLRGERQESRPGERAMVGVMKLLDGLLLAGWRRYRSITARDVAISMIAAAGKKSSGKHIYHFDDMQQLLHG